VQFDGFHDVDICDVELGLGGLPLAQHTVTVELIGRSAQDTRTSGTFYLEVDAFIVSTSALNHSIPLDPWIVS
jgi:hypothetical protein